MRKISTMILTGLFVITALTACGNKPNFEKLYDEYCTYEDYPDLHCYWAELASDGSYLSIDTNPDDEDDYWSSTAYDAVLNIIDELGLPESLTKSIGSTTALMGLQSETYEDIGVKVSWTYHPDNGLEIMFSAIN